MRTRRPFYAPFLAVFLLASLLGLLTFLLNLSDLQQDKAGPIRPRTSTKPGQHGGRGGKECYGVCSPDGTVRQMAHVNRAVSERIANVTTANSEHSPPFDPEAIPKRHRKWVLTAASVSELGTQPKLILHLVTSTGINRTAVFKPKLYSRDWTSEDPCDGFDRHNGELGAYYLRKAMGDFVKTSRVVGVLLDLKRDVWPVRDDRLKRNSWITRDGEYCVKLKCTYCRELVVCGDDHKGRVVKGSMSLWSIKELREISNPWSSTCTRKGREEWRLDPALCPKMIADHPHFSNPNILMDAVDAAVFDFLTDNPDRHHFDYWENKTAQTGAERTGFVLLDNGKTFSNPEHDELGLLAALFQCCLIRNTTYTMLRGFSDTGDLAYRFRKQMARDPLYPFLHHSHTTAVQRRLTKLITLLDICIEKYGSRSVIYNATG